MTKDQFDAAVARFREVAGGTVEIGDFFRVADFVPYRRAEVCVTRTLDGFADELREMGLLAVHVNGYLVMYTGATGVRIFLSVSRDLEPEEIPADPPTHRPVTT